MITETEKEKIAGLRTFIITNGQMVKQKRVESKQLLNSARELIKRKNFNTEISELYQKSTNIYVNLVRFSPKIRCHFLAYGYLKGKSYKQVEKRSNTHPDQMKDVIKYAANIAGVHEKTFATWVQSRVKNRFKLYKNKVKTDLALAKRHLNRVKTTHQKSLTKWDEQNKPGYLQEEIDKAIKKTKEKVIKNKKQLDDTLKTYQNKINKYASQVDTLTKRLQEIEDKIKNKQIA